MSGDVQPRKRKDKRRKKEGGSLGNIHEPVSSHKFKRGESDDKKIFELPDQGEKIHVQNEHGIGGNICVKIIFFCLFGLLVGAVGLIYMKSLGSTDVDLPTIEESRFAEYFTGWLDDNTDDHEHEALENKLDFDEHNEREEHDEHDEHDEHEEHDEHDKHDEHDEHDEEENEYVEDHNSVQDSIYKLFGLQTDETDEAEENDVVANKLPENEESGIRQDVNDNEEGREEEEENMEKEEEDEEDKEEKNDLEEEEEEKEDNDVEEDKNDEKEDEDNDSGVDLEDLDDNDNSEKNTDDDDDDDDEDEDEDENENEDDLSQIDEEEKEEKYDGSEVHEDEDSERNKKDEEDINKIKEKLIAEKQDEDYNNNKDDIYNDSAEEEDDEEQEEDKKDKKNVDSKIDSDDLGYEEIDVSEEYLEEEIEDKLKANQDEGDWFQEDITKIFIKESKKESKIEPVESDIERDEEETEETKFRGAAVKLGVGIALIVVAHLVLVKKWKSMRNSSSDENSTEIETAPEKKEIENIQSSIDPVISRRQTLVPKNICFNNEAGDEVLHDDGDEVDEDEEEEEEEEYSEEECEENELKNSKTDGWETFGKPLWNITRDEKEEGNEEMDNEEGDDVEDEEEYDEEDVEEINDEQEEEVEEEEEEEEEEDYGEEDVDDENYDKNDFVKQKLKTTDDEERVEETPTPPPRTKVGRGPQEVDEDFDGQFEELNEVGETSPDHPRGDEPNNNSGPEEQKTAEKKVGNEDEWAFRQELDFADEQFEDNPKAAVEAYNKIISKKPTLIRALIGRARALDHWAEKEKSNSYLKQAINAYKTLLINHGHLLDDEMYVKLAERCIERMRFAGALASAIDIHKALILKYPDSPKYRNTLAVTYLMLNKIPQAKVLLNETLRFWPEDGFALVHYGFILKTSDNNMEEGATKLMAGIQTRQEGVIDGMFFFHLGDALNRLGRGKEAMKWYELGVQEGLFLSKYQRSLYNVNRLKGQPWWTKEETTYQDFFKKLEDNWREIRREGLELLHSKGVNLYKEEAENLKDSGDWKQLDLYFRGRKQANCNKAPVTCSLVSSFKPASTCTRGQIKFSVMLPNTHVWPHCGPTNCRLRSHLGLVVPKNTFIRVAEETRSWEEGKFIIFDDSFEHEVWHNGTGLRLVLIVDVWHPELTNHERRYLSPI